MSSLYHRSWGAPGLGTPTHGLTCARMYSVIYIAHTWTRADTHRRCSEPGPLVVAAMPLACCWLPSLASLALWAAFLLLSVFVLACCVVRVVSVPLPLLNWCEEMVQGKVDYLFSESGPRQSRSSLPLPPPLTPQPFLNCPLHLPPYWLLVHRKSVHCPPWIRK